MASGPRLIALHAVVPQPAEGSVSETDQCRFESCRRHSVHALVVQMDKTRQAQVLLPSRVCWFDSSRGYSVCRQRHKHTESCTTARYPNRGRGRELKPRALWVRLPPGPLMQVAPKLGSPATLRAAAKQHTEPCDSDVCLLSPGSSPFVVVLQPGREAALRALTVQVRILPATFECGLSWGEMVGGSKRCGACSSTGRVPGLQPGDRGSIPRRSIYWRRRSFRRAGTRRQQRRPWCSGKHWRL